MGVSSLRDGAWRVLLEGRKTRHPPSPSPSPPPLPGGGSLRYGAKRVLLEGRKTRYPPAPSPSPPPLPGGGCPLPAATQAHPPPFYGGGLNHVTITDNSYLCCRPWVPAICPPLPKPTHHPPVVVGFIMQFVLQIVTFACARGCPPSARVAPSPPTTPRWW